MTNEESNEGSVEFIAQVRQSAEDVERIGLQLSRIIEQVQVLSPNFEEAKTGMEHQPDIARQIETAMQNLSEEMYETFAMIGQLNEASRLLETEVSRFTVE